jgi:multiple sugar transport system substrate-binding protein
MPICLALISGPMYDPLYLSLAEFSRSTGIQVEVAFQGDHPTLNEHLAGLATLPYDLVSTHTKYAPSQQAFLAPLDSLFTPAELSDFAPLLLDLARIDGQLYSLPRNVDVRLLHYRTDLISAIPPTWDGLLDLARRVNRPPDLYGFLFPGMQSGLFGTFFELVEAAGGRLFPPNLIPQIENEAGRWTLNFLRACYRERLVPPELTGWHYDRVHDFFRDGRCAIVGDWPGYYQDYCDPQASKVAGRFDLGRYPAGPSGKSRVYGGSHTFGLTARGAANPEAVALLKFLTAPRQQLSEARRGSVPVRRSVMHQIQSEAAPAELKRWKTLETVLAEDVIIPPKLGRYPEIEEVLWTTVQSAMTGRLPVDEALGQMTRQIPQMIEAGHGR